MARITARKKDVGATNRPRDIYEAQAFKGFRELELIDSEGEKVAQMTIKTELVDRRFMDELGRLLEPR